MLRIFCANAVDAAPVIYTETIPIHSVSSVTMSGLVVFSFAIMSNTMALFAVGWSQKLLTLSKIYFPGTVELIRKSVWANAAMIFVSLGLLLLKVDLESWALIYAFATTVGLATFGAIFLIIVRLASEGKTAFEPVKQGALEIVGGTAMLIGTLAIVLPGLALAGKLAAKLGFQTRLNWLFEPHSATGSIPDWVAQQGWLVWIWTQNEIWWVLLGGLFWAAVIGFGGIAFIEGIWRVIPSDEQVALRKSRTRVDIDKGLDPRGRWHWFWPSSRSGIENPIVRFGRVLHWTAIVISIPIFLFSALMLPKADSVDAITVAILGLAIAMIGRALRYVFSGE